MVIPVYNKQSEIRRAILSILNQSYSYFELLVVNDGSTDNSLREAQSISDQRIQIFSQANMGVSAARNRGVSEAKYDWVAFIDADDEWDSEFLNSLNSLINEKPNCGMYASSYVIIDSEGRKENPVTQYPVGSKIILSDIFNDFRSFYPFNSSSVIVNKKKLLEFGGFPLSVYEGEDVITWMKIFLSSDIAILNLPLSIYHQEASNRACQKFVDRIEVYPPVSFLLNAIKQGKIPAKFRESVIEYIAKHQIIVAKRNIRQKRNLQAMKFLWSCRYTREQRRDWLRTLLVALISQIIPKFSNIA